MNFRNIVSSNKKTAGIIALVVILVYGQTVFFDFVHLDEDDLIIGNQSFISSFKNFFEVFKHDVNFPSGFSPYYRPILTLSFMADAFVGGLSPFYYHFTNLALHIAASALVFYLLLSLGYNSKVSLFLSLIFSVHPVLNQAVAWVPGRNDSLLAVFILLSLILFIKFTEKPSFLVFAGHAVFFTLAIFTKETAVVFPLILAAFVYFFKKKFWVSRYAIVLCLSSIAIWHFLRQAVLTTKDQAVYGIGEMIFKHFPATLVYLGKVVVPYGFSVLPTLKDSSLWFGVISLLVLIFLLYKNGISRKMFFGLFWFLLFLLPSLISYDYESRVVFFEHRLYLPLVGFLIVLAEIQWSRVFTLSGNKVITTQVLVVITLSALSLVNLRHFKNRFSFWQSAVANSPNLARAHSGLGSAYLVQNETVKAREEYVRALNLNSQEKKVHNNLGVLYSNEKKWLMAEEEFKKEIEINSLYEAVYYNLGRLYAVNGRFKEAEIYWLKSLELKPDYIKSHQDLAVYYFQIKSYDKSLYHINEIIKYNAPLLPELSKVKSLLEK